MPVTFQFAIIYNWNVLFKKLTEKYVFIIVVIIINDGYSSIKTYLWLKGYSSWLAYNSYIAFVKSWLVLVAGPSFASINPKYFHTIFLSSWVVIKFWSLTGFPDASLHDLDESMSVSCFERDNLLSLTNVCKTYILNKKQIRTNCISGKVRDNRFWKNYNRLSEHH